MVLSYARGSWQFKVASLVASSVAVAVRYGNVGVNFSGNEALVASLMAECDGKNGGNRILVAKGVATLHGKNWAGSLAITFWRQQRCQNLMAAFWAEKVANTFSHKKALSVHGTCWQKGCERLFLRGRRGTYGTGLALVARSASAWQAWYLATCTCILRGRCGTWWHPPSFTNHLSHTTLSHTIFHTPSLTHYISHTIFVAHHLSHTSFHTPSFTHLCLTHTH